MHLLKDQKSLLRNELRRRLASLTAGDRVRRSDGIRKKLFQHPRFSSARSVFTYFSVPTEVETRSIVEEGLKKGKRMYVPRVDWAQKRIQAIEVHSLIELQPGAYGIAEPPLDEKKVGRPEDLDLVIVPGLGFDLRGARLGRGEGYFDRFLKQARRAYKIGLAFECQIVAEIPRDVTDERVDEILVG